MSQLCNFCQHGIDYDFIGKYETIDEDVAFILDKINATESYPDKMMGPTSSRYGKSKTLEIFYSDISPGVLNRIRTKFQKDFDVLGYDSMEF